MSSNAQKLSAEQKFRLAFSRLKADQPEVLKLGAPVTQNNVAKEAGCDPSALRKSRFPTLVAEIQSYVDARQHDHPSKRQVRRDIQQLSEEHQRRLDELESQRSESQSKLVSAHRRIMELSNEVMMLRTRLDDLSPSPTLLTGRKK